MTYQSVKRPPRAGAGTVATFSVRILEHGSTGDAARAAGTLVSVVAASMLLAVFVVGLGAGAVVRRLFAGYQRGCMSIVLLLAFGIVVLLALFVAATAVLNVFDSEVSAGQERTIDRLLWPVAIGGGLVGRFWPRATKISDRRRIVSPAGTHDVPAEIRREPESGPQPAIWPDPPAT